MFLDHCRQDIPNTLNDKWHNPVSYTFLQFRKANSLEYITKFDVYIHDVEHVCGEYRDCGECKRLWTHTFI